MSIWQHFPLTNCKHQIIDVWNFCLSVWGKKGRPETKRLLSILCCSSHTARHVLGTFRWTAAGTSETVKEICPLQAYCFNQQTNKYRHTWQINDYTSQQHQLNKTTELSTSIPSINIIKNVHFLKKKKKKNESALYTHMRANKCCTLHRDQGHISGFQFTFKCSWALTVIQHNLYILEFNTSKANTYCK